MDTEIINEVGVTDKNELLLKISGNGKPIYQYIYREAAGVHWDQNLNGFKSIPLKEWGCSKWFSHIVGVVRSSLDVELKLSRDAAWKNVPENEKAEIIENAI